MVPSYAEPLRVIGQWLDYTLADEAELITTEHTVTVRWRRLECPPDFRTFDWAELRELSECARRNRQNPFGRMTGRWAPLLRTLGQELDIGGVELLLARSLAGGLQVYGIQQRATYSQWIANERIADWNILQHTQRVTRLLRAKTRKRARWPLGFRNGLAPWDRTQKAPEVSQNETTAHPDAASRAEAILSS